MNLNLLITRFILAVIIYVGTTLLAINIGPAEFGFVALGIFLVKNIPSFTLGINQGLIHSIFEEKYDYYKTYFFTYSIIILIVSILYAFFYSFVFGFYAAIFSIIYIFEPYLKTKRDFVVVLFPEALLVSVYLALSFVDNYFIQGVWTGFYLILCSILVFIVYKYRIEPFNREFFEYVKKSKFNFYYLKCLILQGLPSYLFGLLFFVFLFLDRSFVERNFGFEVVGSLMLAYQFSLAAGFVATTLNSTAIVDIGELFKRNKMEIRKYIVKRIIYTTSLNLTFLLVTVFGLFLLKNHYFQSYKNIIELTCIIGFGLASFNAYSSVSPVLFFLRKQYIPVISFASVIVILISLRYFNYFNEVDLLHVEFITFSVFTLSMFVSILYTFFIVKECEVE